MEIKNNLNNNQKYEDLRNNLNRNVFKFLYIIGKGGFGKVWKVSLKRTGVLYALKQMSKAKIIDKKSERSIKYERDLLAKINHLMKNKQVIKYII